MSKEHNKNRNLRIGIIGAGPAGLAAAEALKEKGFNNITILERRNRVGGQALSLMYKTPTGEEIIYEVGSLQPISEWVGPFHRLMKKYNVHAGKGLSAKKPIKMKLYSYDKKKNILDFTKSLIGYPYKDLIPYLADMLKLSYYLFRYRKLSRPGYTDLDKKYLIELSIPYTQWIEERHFRLIEKETKLVAGSMLTFANPELKDKMPAIKFIKLLLQLIKFPPRYINGTFKLMREGYQELLNRIAKNHTILLKADIKQIKREATEITVELKDQTLKFDELIVTCAPDQILRILDVTPEEKEIFSKVHYCPGWRGAFLAKNIPHDALYGFYEPFFNKDYPIRLHTIAPEAQVEDNIWLYQCIFSYSKPEDIESILPPINKAMQEYFGGEIVQWLSQIYWYEYTPYFEGEDVKNGIYNKLEALQGKKHTYYLGGTISGGTHPIIVDYAYKVIDEFFS